MTAAEPATRTVASWPSVSVVVPTLNESSNLARMFAALPHDVDEVVVVDGWSTDGTVAEARRLRPDVVIVEQTGRGKGNALASGFRACRGEVIVVVDADGSTDPRQIPSLVGALVAGADLATCSRFVAPLPNDVHGLRHLAGALLHGLVNLLCRSHHTDLGYGYHAFWAAHLPVLGLDAGPRPDRTRMCWGDGFEIATLIGVRIARAGLRIAEVPSDVRGDLQSDGVRVLRTVLTEFRREAPVPAAGPIRRPHLER